MGSSPEPYIEERWGSFVVVYPDGYELKCHNLGTARYYLKSWRDTGFRPPS